MKLPQSPYGTRYNGSTDFNTRITIVQPNAGADVDGSSLPENTVASVWANVSMWRGKQSENKDALQAISSYKMVIRYPKHFSMDTGMNILVRNQRHNIESFADPDGNRIELHIWTWVGNDTVGS